jgi:hypothetical protein
MSPQEKKTSPQSERADLDARYAAIGISAVAAAVQYKGDARNPKYAPVTPDPDAQARIAEQNAA